MTTTNPVPTGAERQLPADAIEIKFPSGASGWFRPIRVSEENLLTEETLNRGGGQTINRLLKACWLGMKEPGPYKGLPGAVVDGDFNLDEMLLGDRMYYLVALRSYSFRDGHLYQFKVQCPACARLTEGEVDLLKDLAVLPLPSDSRKALDGGKNLFEFVLPKSKRVVRFHLATGRDEARLAALSRKELAKHGSSEMLLQRIEEIVGLECEAGMEDLARRDWIEREMSSYDSDALRDEMDRVDCGLATGIEVRCEQCGAPFETELPFGVGFLLPQRGRQKRAATLRTKGRSGVR